MVNDLYDVIRRRRDVRAEFTGAPVPEAVLRRVLGAAHAAPSVGLSQPWDFVLVRDAATLGAFHEHVRTERDTFAATLDADAARRFARIKIDGVLESSLSVVVTYDPARGGPAVLGRHAIADAGLYSVCLAIQNLWLAATAEDLGVGWVSFYREEFLQDLLGIPDSVRPVAWLCLGPVTHLETVPDLERHGWRHRTPLSAALHQERWQRSDPNRPGPGIAGPGPGTEQGMDDSTPIISGNPAAARTVDASGTRTVRTGADQEWTAEDLAVAEGHDPTPANVRRAQRELDELGPAAIEKTVP